MVWDSLLVAALTHELDGRLRGAKLRAVHLDHAHLVATVFLKKETLAIRLGHDDGRITVHEPGEPFPDARRLASRVVRVWCPPDDRVLVLEVERTRGGREPWSVVVELIPRARNVVLAQGEERRIRGVLKERRGPRPLTVGRRWVPPEATGRAGAGGELSADDWGRLVQGRERSQVIRGLAWCSPLNVDPLLDRTSRDPADGLALWRALVASIEDPEPVVFGADAQPYPYPIDDGAIPKPSVLEAVADTTAPEPPPIPSSILSALEARVQRARKRIGALERELEGTPDPDAIRETGHLMLARLDQVPRGRESVTLEDFTGRSVTVELDPTLEPHQNADACFERAARAERALERLPELIAEAKRDLREATDALERAREGELTVDPATFREGPVASDEPALPYRTYTSSGGLEIRVGRSAKANDDLTFHHSRPGDVWLHARHSAGAHVVLRWDSDDAPPARDLHEAGALAAWHSRARSSGSVPVDWTRRRYVRKPRKSPPGRVTMERAKTIFVSPSDELEARLRT